jgi:predicted transcriptional regulator of viral defense system
MPNIMLQLRSKSQGEEIDYTFVMDCLQEYKSPRAKLTTLLKKGDLIRVKKGLYLFGSDYRKGPYSPEVMANKIYGPSYVSREYALAYYGLIPEYVAEVTSISTKRARSFNTAIGRFSYTCLPLKLYQVHFNLVSVRNNETALLATPEKALADLLYFRNYHLDTLDELIDLLFDDLRLDDKLVRRMRIGMFHEILEAGGSPIIKLIIGWIKRQR